MIVTSLRKVLTDAAIAMTLNREGIQTREGKTWTKTEVRAFRASHGIPDFDAKEKKAKGWLTQAETATCLKISPMSVTRLVQNGTKPSEQPHSGLPAVVKKSDLGERQVKRAVNQLKKAANRPLPDHPGQLTLFDTTNS